MAYETEHSLSTGTPNDSVSTANLLQTGEKTFASLATGSDSDYFKIVVEQPGLIRITFDTLTSSTAKPWNIALLDSAGQDYLLSPTRSSAGTAVQVKGGDQTGTSLIVDGLSALPTAGDRFTIATSGADTTIYTVMSASTLSGTESTLTLDKAISSPADNAYLIFDPVQGLVGNATSTTLTAQVSTAGTYYLKVAANAWSNAEYGVTATAIPTTEGAGTGDDNDTKADAVGSNNRLIANVAMTGNLSDETDVDYWVFTTAAASDFTLNFAATSGNASSNEWTITATDWSGQAILDSTGTAISLNAGTSASASISDEINATAKTYVVKVALASGATVNTGDYILKVSGTNLDLNDTPSLTIGTVTSTVSGALINTGVVKALPAGATGESGTGVALSSLFTASDADTAVTGQTLSYKFTLEQPASGANTTGYIQVGNTQYGFGDGMTSPVNVTLSQAQMDSATFYPGDDTGDMTLTLQAIDSLAASGGSSNGALLSMTLRVVSAGTSVTVADASTEVALLEGDTSSADTLNISLGAAPASGETVTVYIEHDSEAAGSFELDFSTTVLTFNSTNYSTAQSVVITAREDNTKESSQTGQVSFRVVSSDTSSDFHNLAITPLTYTLTDAANHAPTGSVTLSGTLTQGQTLTASNDLADSDGIGKITYTWQESADGSTWTTIAGSTTGSTYTLANAQVGNYVRVVAGYIDDAAKAESVASSTSTSTIANINDTPTVANAIADQTAVAGRLFSYTVASNAFSDVDPADSGGTLTYSVTQVTDATGATPVSSGVALGDWLSFDASTRTFSASSVGGTAGAVIWLKVTATDNATTPTSASDIFKITVADAATGTPVLNTALADQSATEDTAFSYSVASGTFTDTDNTTGTVDTTSSLTYTATLASGTELPDWLDFDASTQAFSGTPANADVGTLSVKVTASDGTLSTSDIFNIAVANTNDQPTGGVTVSGTATQGNTLTMSNTLVDADGLGTLAYQWQASADSGTTWTNISGANSTTYKLTQAEVGKLVRGTISYTDARGTLEVYSTSGNLDNLASAATSAVTNINDAPIAVADTATAVEAGGTANATAGTSPTGNVLTNDTDADSGDTKTVSAISGGTVGSARVGTYGSLTLNSDGAYTYTVNDSNAAVQALRTSSNTLTDTFTYTVRDTGGLTSTANLVVTIQGANDAPTVANVISDNTSLYAGNAGTITFAANTFADVDSGDTLTYAATQADGLALPSWLSFDASTRTFTTSDAPAANTSVMARVTATDTAGATVYDDFVITVQDPGTKAPTLATITAIAYTDTAGNDTFTASSNVVLDGNKGTGSSAALTALTYSIDNGTDGGATWSKAGTYGTLTLTEAAGSDGNSTFTYTPTDSAIEGLTGTAKDEFTLRLTDPTNSLSATRILTVNLTGANDAPVLTAPTAINFTDTSATDDFAVTSASLVATDADTGAALIYGISGGADAGTTVTQTGSLGTLSVNKTTGAYTFTPLDTAVNAAGGNESESYAVTVSDGVAATVTQTLTVSVIGTGDTAVNDRPTLTTVGNVTGGTEGQAKTITYEALAVLANEVDVEGQAISFRVEAVSTGTLTKGGAAVTAGETTLGTGQVLIWTPAAYANGTLNAFTIKAVDSQGGVSATAVQVKVEVAESSDPPVSSGAIDNTQIVDGGATTASGAALALMANASDPDGVSNTLFTIANAKTSVATSFSSVTTGTTSANGTSVTGTYGTLVVGADGSYAYTLDSGDTVAAAVTALPAGQSLTDSFIVQVNDGSANGNQTLNIVITGINNAPTVSAALTSAANEDAEAYSLSLTTNASDVDTGTTLSVTNVTYAIDGGSASSTVPDGLSLTGTTLSIDPTHAGFASLAASATRSIVVAYSVSDGAGGTVNQTATVTITGTNDAPTVSAGAATATLVEAGGVANGTAGTASVTITLTKADVDGTASYDTDYLTNNDWNTADSGTTYTKTGTYGTATFTVASGGVSYALNDSDADTQALAAGASVSDSFGSIQVSDGTATSTVAVSFAITGSNDAPTTSGGTVTAVAATAYTFKASDFGFSDVDTGAALSAVRIDTLPTVGTFQLEGVAVTAAQTITVADINANKLTFTPAASAAGTGYANFTYSVSDGTVYNTTPATMTINAGYTLTGTVKEWKDGTNLTGAVVTVNGNAGLTGTVDANGAFTVAAIDDAYGTVTATATLASPTDKTAANIKLGDALAALKIALGSTSYQSYQYVAADFNKDGSVKLGDALAILKYALGSTQYTPEWVFMDVADAGLSVDGTALSKSKSTPHVIDQNLASDTTIELVGILRGDVDGSWAPAV